MHELADKIINCPDYRNKSIDGIICEWLSEKAKEIDEPYKYPTPRTRHILGLESPKEPEKYSCKGLTHFWKDEVHEHPGSVDCPNKSEAKKSEKVWCQHLTWKPETVNRSYGYWAYKPTPDSFPANMDSHKWKQCPICGSPRPVKEKELWEKLADIPYQVYMVGNTPGSIPDYRKMAQVAEAHFTSKKEK